MASTTSVKTRPGRIRAISQRTNAIVSTVAGIPAVTLSNAFTLLPGGQLLAPVGNGDGAASFLGQAVTANYLDRPLPYSHQYSFDIQRELPHGVLVEGATSGNQSRKLPINSPLQLCAGRSTGPPHPAGAIDHGLLQPAGAEPDGGTRFRITPR